MDRGRRQGGELLGDPGSPFHALAENATDAIVILDAESRVRFANAAAQRVFGYAREELLGRDFAALVPERLRGAHRAGMERYLATSEPRIPWSGIELPGLHASGREILLEVSFSEFAVDGERYFTGIMRDVGERRAARQRRSVQGVVTAVLAESPALERAAAEILAGTCRALGWNVGILWQVDPDAVLLRPVEAWFDPRFEATEFAASSRALTFEPGEGLPGRVWRLAKPAWITDAAVAPDFPRAAVAARAGLHAALAFPIVLEDRVLGVMEFFNHEIHEPDEELLELLASVGVQIGQFVRRKQAEEAVHAWEEHYRFALASAGAGTWEHDPATGREVWSDNLYELYGVDPARFTPSHEAWLACLHPDDRAVGDERTREIVREGIPEFSDEFRIVHPEKGVRWMLNRGRTTFGPDGAPIRRMGTVVDITDRKRAEEALQEGERNFRSVFENAAVGIARLDPEGRYVQVNGRFAAMLGYAPERLVGLGYRDVTHPEDLAACEARFGAILRGETDAYSVDKRYLREDGGVVWGRLTFSAVRDGEGLPLHFVAIVEDVGERKRAEAALRELNATLEERVADRTSELQLLNQELDTFSYSVSHDLRAPLRSLHGFSEALAEEYGDQLEGVGRTYLERIQAATERMRELIDTMLRLAQHTRAELDVRDVDLTRLASDVAEALREGDPERDVAIEIEAGLRARGDERLLRIALENLLGNAWKFTRGREGARIGFRSERHGGEAAFVVRDNGAGFDAAYAERLFVPFGRLHSEREFEGSGVGLATVQRIVRRHGGRVWAEGAPGEGAAFYFTLPGRSRRGQVGGDDAPA